MQLERIARAVVWVVGVAAICCGESAAQQALGTDSREKAGQILKKTMFSRDFQTKRFEGGEWSGSGDTYTALEPSSIPNATDIVQYNTAAGDREILIAASRLIPRGEKNPLAIEEYSFSPDQRELLVFTNSKTVWRQNTRGDYWVLNLQTGGLRKLGGDTPPSSLMFAKFSPDGTKVAYVRGNNVYAEELATGKIKKLTNDGTETVMNGTSDWVNEEEFDIRDGFQWSPDGRSIAFWQFNTEGVKRYTLTYDLSAPRGEIVTGIPYPGPGVYPESLLYPYPIAGTRNSTARVGVVRDSGGPVVWMKAGEDSDTYIPRWDWVDAGHLLLQHMNRLQNRNDFLLAETKTGTTKAVFREEDAKAWVELNEKVRWVDSGKEFVILSERDGWRHLYRVSVADGKLSLITRGDFDVVSVCRITPDERWVYFIASPENATQRYLYRAAMDGSGPPERITPSIAGTHSYEISPNGEFAFHQVSSLNMPPMSDVIHLPDHRVLRVTADNSALVEKIKLLSSGSAEMLKLDAGNGLVTDAWLMKPPNFDSAKHYPLIVYVYSEPAGQTTVDQWPSLFLRALAATGYLVTSFDNAGTPAPRGRDWRKAVYRNVGPLSSAQQAEALKSLEKAHPYIDPTRVGVWGWSGGGTETLNLMFRYPTLYSVGVSIASVPDQRLYDSIYQERYMGLPQDNPKSYQESSAINFAEGLGGWLLVMHGSGDDNVHFQGFELLVNKLISLGKNFDMRVYPGRTHGIFEGKGTSEDVFKNILGYFLEHLPPDARTASPGQ